MKKFALFFIMFTSITTIVSNLPTKQDLLQCFVEIITNQKPGRIQSKNAPYPQHLLFRNPNEEEKTSIFHNETHVVYCKNNEIIETHDISTAFQNANIPPHLYALIANIVHCIQGGRIISDPSTQRSIEIWNDRGEITKIE